MTATTNRQNFERIAGQLLQRPVYVILTSEGIPDHVAPFSGPNVGGTYHPRLDLSLMEYLKAQGRWAGRQPAVHVNDTYGDGFQPLAVLCHELAHCVDIGFCEAEPEQVPDGYMQRMHEAWNKQRERTEVFKPIPADIGYDPDHGPSWCRAAIHLWYRCHLLGHWFPFENLWEGSWYGTPEPIEVRRVLDDEIERFRPLWLNTIRILPTPPKFDELFANRKDKSQ